MHAAPATGKTLRPTNQALADFIAPKDSGRPDYIGAFAVTAGIGIDEFVAKFKADHDDYNAIMTQALADRLAEAFAELLHKKAREVFGYGQAETISVEELIKEKYRGIRPAPGYPACPDHTEKRKLFDLLQAEERAGITNRKLRDVSGKLRQRLVFRAPRSEYFAVGKIERDQVEEYAERKGIDVTEAERWLAPNLNYYLKQTDGNIRYAKWLLFFIFFTLGTSLLLNREYCRET